MNNTTAVVINGIDRNGTAICRQLCQSGVQVIAVYQNQCDQELAEAWHAEQQVLGYNIHIKYLDTSHFEECSTFAYEIENTDRSIGILINNIDIMHNTLLRKLSYDARQAELKANLSRTFNITRNLLNGMIDRHYGRIINISFIDIQNDYSFLNGTAKAGVHGFTKILAQEVIYSGVTVNTISTIYMAENAIVNISNGHREKSLIPMPNNQLGKSNEIARAVCFFAAKESEFITGSNLVINGGFYLSNQ